MVNPNMIRQQVGDVLEIEYEGRCFYVVILTRIVMFGGNVVFAYHNDGQKMSLGELAKLEDGFNICTDLLYFKRTGAITRIGRLVSVEHLYHTRLMKSTSANHGDKADQWAIYSIEDLGRRIDVVRVLSDEYRKAMDRGTFPFDLVAKKIMSRYSPELDDRI